MPDQWGRFSFSDGLQIANTVEYFKHENEREQEKKLNEDAYKVADAMSNKQDISGFAPESRYKGAKLYWDNNLNELRSKTQQMQLSNEGMQQKVNKLKLNLDEAGQRLREYKAARAAGDDKTARQIAMQINNENMYNGRYVQPSQGERGGYDVTNWDGSKQNIGEIPMDKIDAYLGAYFDKPPDEIMQWQMSAEQLRAQKNADVLSKAEPYINEKTGKIIYKVPAGVWGPDGKPRGSFFVDDPNAQSEVPPDQTKGFVKFSVASGKAGLEASKTTTAKNKVINPTDIVTQGGKAGLVTQAGGGAQFSPIQGGLDTSSLPAKTGQMNAGQTYNMNVKQLETELMPFVEKGKSAIDPETLEITNDGRNAIMSAIKLLEKNKENPTSLTQPEKSILPNAMRAVQMYQTLSEFNKKTFGLQGGEPQAAPAPPPGFVINK
jgi:hypothetical protein